MQKNVLFMEPNDDAWRTPFKIAELVINWFYFEEEASFKIVNIFEFEKSTRNQQETKLKTTKIITMKELQSAKQNRVPDKYLY